MKEQYESLYHKLEKEQWWFIGRRNALIEHVKSLSKKEDLKVLDIGCSIGMLIDELVSIGLKAENITGIDISEKAILTAQKRGVQNVHVMDAQAITFEDNQFDLIVSSDCLEHLEQDSKALKKWHNLLKPNGLIIIYVPALMSLWSNHDVVNMHYRRYTVRELRTKMEDVGFTIKHTSYWNFFLFFIVWIIRKLNNILKKSDDSEAGDMKLPPKFINSILLGLLKIENKVTKSISFPVGVSVFVIAQK